jgi:hypothetical protein
MKRNILLLCVSILMMQGTTIAKTNQKTSLFSRVMPLGGELSAGLRFGGASGLTIKKYNKNNKSALELVTAFNFFTANERMRMNFLYEKLTPITKNKRLSALIGGGVGMKFDPYCLGIVGTLGFDWRITDKLNMQLDWQPTWLFIGNDEFYGMNAGYSIRYNF